MKPKVIQFSSKFIGKIVDTIYKRSIKILTLGINGTLPLIYSSVSRTYIFLGLVDPSIKEVYRYLILVIMELFHSFIVQFHEILFC